MGAIWQNLPYRRHSANISYFHDFLCGPPNKETEEEEKMGETGKHGVWVRGKEESQTVKRSGVGELPLSPPLASTADSTLKRFVSSLPIQGNVCSSVYSGGGLRESLTPLDYLACGCLWSPLSQHLGLEHSSPGAVGQSQPEWTIRK